MLINLEENDMKIISRG